jgi:hypothetical protein
MNMQNNIEQEIVEKSNHLKYLKFEVVNDNYEASLNDTNGYIMIKGYGKTIIEAINDLHHNLI